MAILLSEKSLMLETPEIQEHLDRYLPVEHLFPFPPSGRESRIPLRINQLYWPSGADRYSRMLCLADEATKDELVEGASGGYLLDFGTVSMSMRLLTPRPASGLEKGLWLIPLVDVRYFWLWMTTGDLDVSSSTEWTALFAELADILGATVVVESVSSDYRRPDPATFTQQYSNPAELLELAARSIGRRVVANLDETFTVQDWTTAESAARENLDNDEFRRVAGGEMTELVGVPATATVSFPEIVSFMPSIDGTRYSYEVSPGSEYDGETEAGRTAQIQGQAYADFTDDGGYNGSDPPDNDTALQALADKIGADFYSSLLPSYDVSYAGAVNWVPTAYDDFILWTPGRLRDSSEGGGREFTTRVCSAAMRADPINAAQDQDLTIYDARDSFKLGTADEGITAGSSGTVNVFDDGSDSGDDVEAYFDHAEGGEGVSSGKEVMIRYLFDRKKWQGVAAECE